jgi:hypothetical protein
MCHEMMWHTCMLREYFSMEKDDVTTGDVAFFDVERIRKYTFLDFSELFFNGER